MTRVRSVLCPVDFSEHSRRAYEYAVALAALYHARLTVLSVIDPLLAQAAAATYDPDYLRDTKAELRAFVSLPRLAGLSWATTPNLVVTIGQPGDQILEVARFHQADLIVMGTQGLGGLRKLVFGSTTERVLRRTDVPVLAVPLDGTPLATFEAQGPVFRIDRVICAVDFKPGTPTLARAAAEIARTFHASLLLTHVVRPVQAASRWQQSREAATTLHRQTADAAMDDLVTRLDPAVAVEPLVTAGHAAEAITSLGDARHAQLIVIGAGSGESALHRPGSTAYQVLCLSNIPVLVVPPVAAGPAGAEQHSEARHAPA
jgi:nucleotide-binding universal stress UspA family protein